MRWIILTHRYLGIAFGLLMLLWCLSGFVMMYVPYPELSQEERLRHLQPLDWSSCCTLGEDVDFTNVEIEMTEGVPVLTSGPTVINLTTGQPFTPRAMKATAQAYGEDARLKRVIDYDQWTVSSRHPLYLFEDDTGAQIYVSSNTGRVVQVTTPHQRFWGWLGAVPHPLAPLALRRPPHLRLHSLPPPLGHPNSHPAIRRHPGCRHWRLRRRKAPHQVVLKQPLIPHAAQTPRSSYSAPQATTLPVLAP
jgi:hypothetical protein